MHLTKITFTSPASSRSSDFYTQTSTRVLSNETEQWNLHTGTGIGLTLHSREWIELSIQLATDWIGRKLENRRKKNITGGRIPRSRGSSVCCNKFGAISSHLNRLPYRLSSSPGSRISRKSTHGINGSGYRYLTFSRC